MNHLMESLLDKNGISKDTVITAYHQSRDSYGRVGRRCDQFTMIDVWRLGNEYQLKLKQVTGTEAVTIWARDIVALDGMDPSRYVDIYDINPDGTQKRVGKKRGRKPKNPIP